jgi:hypothetical protein
MEISMNTTDASRATAEAMPDVQSENGKMPSLYRRLANYWDRCEALSKAMDATDETKAGTNERKAADVAQTFIGNEVNEAALAVCAFVPTMVHEARMKTNFLEKLATDNGGMLDKTWTRALLSSLPTLVAWRRKGGEA